MSPDAAAGTCWVSTNPGGRPIVSVMVIEFITLDGIVSEPDRSQGG